MHAIIMVHYGINIEVTSNRWKTELSIFEKFSETYKEDYYFGWFNLIFIIPKSIFLDRTTVILIITLCVFLLTELPQGFVALLHGKLKRIII